jgi:uncharacterized repeat protein (TIGR01451 family)
MQVDALTPLLEVVPGQPVIGRIRVVNDTTRDTNYRIRVVGIDAPTEWRQIAGGAVPAGTEVHVEVPILVPDLLGVGQHPVGVEVTSDQTTERPGLASIMVSVESVANVQLRADPSIIRGTTRGKFQLTIENREPNPVDLHLVGGANDITAKFKPDRLRLLPGERGTSKGKVKGRRRWSGDSEQHFVTLTARGHASSQSITTRFVQRSMFPWRFRTLVAALVIFALWIAGAGAYVWYQRDKANDLERRQQLEQNQDVETEGSTDGSGDGSGNTGSADAGAGSDAPGGGDAAGGAGAEQKEQFPTETSFGGAVTLADGSDPSAVRVSLDEIPLGQAVDGAAPVAFVGASGPAKIWSARYGSADRPGIRALRQTETVRSVDTTKDGTWRIPNVVLRRNYEVVFSLAGYNTQSFVVTPPEDGSPVDLEVELTAGSGIIAGVVRDASGAVGGVSLTATDGDLTFATTSSTDPATLGQFSFNGLNTPAVYSVTAKRDGFGTEVVQFEMAAGQGRTEEVISMRAGVGSITGTVVARQPDIGDGTTEQPFGGVTVTVTNGDLVRTVTTLTEGATGTFSVPRLPIPGTYTVSAVADGYAEASATIVLTGARGDLQLRLINQSAILRGLVVDADCRPVAGAGVTLTRDDLSFTSSTVSDETGDAPASSGQFMISDGLARLREATASGASPGEFRVNDLPPGEYRIEIVHFAHEPYSTSVTLAAGDDLFLPIELVQRKEIPGATQSLRVFATENGDRELDGVEFWLRRPGAQHDPTVPGSIPQAGNKIVEFADLSLGTYILRAELENYRTKEILVSVGEQAGSPQEISLRPFGNVVVRITDAITEAELGSYDVRIVEIRDDGLDPQIIEGAINDPDEQVLNGIVWATGIVEELNDGLWKVEVRQHPDGYRVLDQDIIFEPPTVDPITEPLQFEVSADSRPTINVNLTANAFPNVKVRTYEPPPSTGDPLEVTVLGDPSLTVVLDCGGNLQFTAVPDTTAAGTPTGVYNVFKEMLDSPDVLESDVCKITVDGADYQQSVAPLNGKLQLASDAVTFDRQVGVVMLPPAVTITGRISWYDGVSDVYLPGTPIRSVDPVTINYESTQTVGAITPDKPVATQDHITAVWNDNVADSARRFTITGQVFDSGDYLITYPDATTQTIETGTAKLTIPFDTGAGPLTLPNPATTSLDSPATPGTAVFDFYSGDNRYDYDVKLLRPDEGRLQGCLTVNTIRDAPNFDEIISRIEATPIPSTTSESVTVAGDVPNCPTDDDQTWAASQTQGFGRAATAGFWNVEYVLPEGGWYQFSPTVPAPADQRVNPGETVSGFDHTVVENATINLTVEPETAMPGLSQPDFNPTFTLTPSATGTAVYEDRPVDDTSGANTDPATETIRGVPVNAGSPFVPAGQTLSIEAPGYDIAGADVTVGSGTPIVDIDAGALVFGAGAGVISPGLVAGEDIDVTVSVAPLGSLSGTVEGYSWTPGDLDAGDFGDLSQLEVYARRVEFTTTVGAPDTHQFASATDWVLLEQPTPLDFTYSEIPGFYEFKVSHPDYRAAFTSPTGEIALDTGEQLFEMKNSENRPIPGVFGLQLLPADLAVNLWSAFNDPVLPDAALENGAQMRVTLLPNTVIGQNNLPDPNLNTQLWNLSDAASTQQLQPGTYRLEIFQRVNGVDQAYPVAIEITLLRTGLQVDAVLPSLIYELWVTVKVVNEDWMSGDTVDLNRLPVPAGVTITRTWDPPSALLSDGTTSTLVTNSTIVAGTPARYVSESKATVGSGVALEEIVKFTGVPSGEHTIQIAGPPDGYRILSAPNSTAPVPETTQSDITSRELILVVDDVSIDVRITGSDGDDFPGATAQLRYNDTPVVDSNITVTRSVDEPTVIRLTGVPPRSGNYTLRIDDDLHAQKDVAFPALVDTDLGNTDPQQVSTTVSANIGRIEGRLRLENAEGACDDFAGADCPGLPDDNTDVLTIDGIDYARPPASFTYRVDRGTAGSHVIVAGYGADYVGVTSTEPLVLGRLTTFDIVLRKKPVVTVTLTDPPTDADVTVTTPNNSTIPGVTTTGSSTKTWTFVVLPDVSYQFTATAAGHYDLPVPTVATSYGSGATPGYPTSGTLSLERRIVRVEVTKPDQDGLASATVNLTIGAAPFGSKTATFSGQATTATVVFGDTGALLPLIGTATATASADGYRTVDGTSGDDVRDATIMVSILPDVTVTGLIRLGTNPVPLGTEVIATRTSPPAVVCTLTTNNAGRYRFRDGAPNGELCPGAIDDDNALDIGDWVISSSAVGWGEGTNNAAITAQSSTTLTRDISLTGRPLTLTVDARRVGTPGTPVSITSVDLIDGNTVTNLPASSRVVTLTEAGRTDYLMHTVLSGNLRTAFTYTMGATDFDGNAPYTATSRVVRVYAAAPFSGLVVRNSNGNEEGNAYVWLQATPCPTSRPSIPNSTVRTANGGATDGQFTFAADRFDPLATAFNPAGTDFCVVSRQNTNNNNSRWGAATLNVRADGAGALTIATTAQASGSNETITVPIPVRSLDISNTVNPTSISAPGTLTYTITVENTGNVDLSGVVVTDNLGGTVTLTSGDTSNTGVLDADETWIYGSTYAADQDDINAGTSLVNTASVVTSQLPTAKTAAATTTITQSPSLTISNVVSPTSISGPGTLTYTITVENTGNVDLTGVVVTDNLGGTVTLTSGDTSNTGVLDADETWIYGSTYAATAADITAGTNLVNTASVVTTQLPTAQTSVATTTIA